MCGFCAEREDIYEEEEKNNFQNPLNGSKQLFSLLCTKKKFKNDQDVCWQEKYYMEMIVRDQSKNYFHLTPKIGPL